MEPKRTTWLVTAANGKTLTVAADSRQEAIMKGVAGLGCPRSEVTATRVKRPS